MFLTVSPAGSLGCLHAAGESVTWALLTDSSPGYTRQRSSVVRTVRLSSFTGIVANSTTALSVLPVCLADAARGGDACASEVTLPWFAPEIYWGPEQRVCRC